jgi:hypothetical protein
LGLFDDARPAFFLVEFPDADQRFGTFQKARHVGSASAAKSLVHGIAPPAFGAVAQQTGPARFAEFHAGGIGRPAGWTLVDRLRLCGGVPGNGGNAPNQAPSKSAKNSSALK